MKIRPVGVALLDANRRTDGQARQSLQSLFGIYAKAPENCDPSGLNGVTIREELYSAKIRTPPSAT